MGQNLKRDSLYWNLLRVLLSEEKEMTAQEVLDAYKRKRPKPPTFVSKVRRFFSLPLWVSKVERYLQKSVNDGLVDCKGMTGSTEVTLEEDTKIYAISRKGRSVVHRKKKS